MHVGRLTSGARKSPRSNTAPCSPLRMEWHSSFPGTSLWTLQLYALICWCAAKKAFRKGLPCFPFCSERDACCRGMSPVQSGRRGTRRGNRGVLPVVPDSGPFHLQSQYATLNSLLKDFPEGSPQDVELPKVLTRQYSNRKCPRGKFCMGPKGCRGCTCLCSRTCG